MKQDRRTLVRRAASLAAGLVFCLATAFSAFAQDSPAAKKWVRLVTANNELSVAVPPGFIVDAEKRGMEQKLKVVAFENGAMMELIIRRPDDPHRSLGFVAPAEGKTTDFVKGKMKGKRNVAGAASDHISDTIFLASNKNFYYLRVVSKAISNGSVDRFLRSIKINSQPLFVIDKPVDEPEETVSITSLTTSVEVKEAFDRVETKGNVAGAEFAGDPLREIYDYRKFSRAPIIVDQPWPTWHPSLVAKEVPRVNYAARVRVELLANGRVGKVVSETNVLGPFIDSCIEAARKLRFIPAQIDGRNVDSSELVDYSMSMTKLYGSDPNLLPITFHQ